jgi:hypothetical protein
MWYEVDKKDFLVAVSPDWDELVIASNNLKLLGRAIIGKSLSEFISGDVSNMFTETMIQAARVRQQPIIKPYRCDSPTHKRIMQMILTPFLDGRVRIAHELVSETPWLHPKNMRTVTNRQRISKIKRCTMCNNLLDGDEWVTLDRYLENHSEYTPETLSVFYGICPNCSRI